MLLRRVTPRRMLQRLPVIPVPNRSLSSENQEIDIKEPVVMVGGTSLIQGLVKAMGTLLQTEITVPHHSQYIGSVGAALLSSGFVEKG